MAAVRGVVDRRTLKLPVHYERISARCQQQPGGVRIAVLACDHERREAVSRARHVQRLGRKVGHVQPARIRCSAPGVRASQKHAQNLRVVSLHGQVQRVRPRRLVHHALERVRVPTARLGHVAHAAALAAQRLPQRGSILRRRPHRQKGLARSHGGGAWLAGAVPDGLPPPPPSTRRRAPPRRRIFRRRRPEDQPESNDAAATAVAAAPGKPRALRTRARCWLTLPGLQGGNEKTRHCLCLLVLQPSSSASDAAMSSKPARVCCMRPSIRLLQQTRWATLADSKDRARERETVSVVVWKKRNVHSRKPSSSKPARVCRMRPCIRLLQQTRGATSADSKDRRETVSGVVWKKRNGSSIGCARDGKNEFSDLWVSVQRLSRTFRASAGCPAASS
mmetsp:Transcript_7835/g.23566  ORF Transcript_7835/g.23566 Transcript_7835/m.23566 type:complete len:392 (-) Transcript_7835:79-1254(-)